MLVILSLQNLNIPSGVTIWSFSAVASWPLPSTISLFRLPRRGALCRGRSRKNVRRSWGRSLSRDSTCSESCVCFCIECSHRQWSNWPFSVHRFSFSEVISPIFWNVCTTDAEWSPESLRTKKLILIRALSFFNIKSNLPWDMFFWCPCAFYHHADTSKSAWIHFLCLCSLPFLSFLQHWNSSESVRRTNAAIHPIYLRWNVCSNFNPFLTLVF